MQSMSGPQWSAVVHREMASDSWFVEDMTPVPFGLQAQPRTDAPYRTGGDDTPVPAGDDGHEWERDNAQVATLRGGVVRWQDIDGWQLVPGEQILVGVVAGD